MYKFYGLFDKTQKLNTCFSKENNNENFIEPGNKCQTFQYGDSEIYFWGNIYNLKELSLRIRKGRTSEAELVLINFCNEKDCAVQSFDGDFSFIIFHDNEIIMFRDRHGAGPQIFYNNYFFTNNLSDFNKLKDHRCEADTDQLGLFLTLGYVPTSHTAFKNIKRVPPGKLITIRKGTSTERDVFDFQDFIKTYLADTIDVEEMKEQYEFLHKICIQRRIESSKNVGVLLSGGYDSAGNISSLRDIYEGKISSFSIGFRNNTLSELPMARLLSESFNSVHHEYEIDGTEIQYLPDIVEHCGNPFQESGLMVNYSVMRLAAQHDVDLLLGGDGNDQLFGTAARELALYYLFKEFGLLPFIPLIKSLAPLHPKISRTSFHLNRIQNVLKGDHSVFHPNEVYRLFNGNFHKRILGDCIQIPKAKGYFDDYYQYRNYYIDILQNINEVIVFKAARMSELFQQKLSFPYLGTDLYNFLKKKPREYKNKGSLTMLAKGQGVSKYLLKAMLEKKLSPEITQKKKQGGFTPLALFFGQKDIANSLINYIQNASCAKELMNKKQLNNHLSMIRNAGENSTMWFWTRQAIFNKAFNLLVLCVWWDIFVDNKKNIELINR